MFSWRAISARRACLKSITSCLGFEGQGADA
jgi:hypothetical protein